MPDQKISNLKKELEKNQILLIAIPKSDFLEKMIDISKQVSEISEKCCHVSLIHPHSSIIEKFKEKNINIDKFFFIDTLTSSVRDIKDAPNCKFVRSPSNLTEISIAFSEIIKSQKINSSIFDSLQTFFVYRDKGVVTQFLHNIISKSRVSKIKLILIAVREEIETGSIGELRRLVDKIIEIE
jgi:archaellum biogenesis ATPase FlaH